MSFNPFLNSNSSGGFSGDYNDLINKPTIPTVSNDLTDELKEHYDLAYNQSHTHSNKDVLDEITSNKITAWDGYSAEIEKINSTLVRKTIQFRHGKGTFTATATGTNVVWQYGGQKAQGSNCTFDVKSDNGLICMDFDSITVLSIKNDAENKMGLSDLGGKITNELNLNNCQKVTGDLSDLGGKITEMLSLANCSNITGDLSDLDGKITKILDLGNCQKVTGDLSDLGGKITKTLSLVNCINITGDLSDLDGKITKILSLANCSNITGDLSDLDGKITEILDLNNCQKVTGVYSGTKYPNRFSVSKTAITSADMDANLINFAASGVKSGTFSATGMKRTAASDDAVATLVANGWTVLGLTKEG